MSTQPDGEIYRVEVNADDNKNFDDDNNSLAVVGLCALFGLRPLASIASRARHHLCLYIVCSYVATV